MNTNTDLIEINKIKINNLKALRLSTIPPVSINKPKTARIVDFGPRVNYIRPTALISKTDCKKVEVTINSVQDIIANWSEDESPMFLFWVIDGNPLYAFITEMPTTADGETWKAMMTASVVDYPKHYKPEDDAIEVTFDSTPRPPIELIKHVIENL